jgi:tRNA threonylcarbamoyladenosine modification (KEOPS) complex Cgi121 subunit
MKKYYFDLGKKKIIIYNIYASININNIENYLKRIEEQQKGKKSYLDIIIIPNTLIYSKDQLLWSIFIAKNKIFEKMNISKNLQNEVLLTLNCSDQLNKIDSDFMIKEGKNTVFLEIISSKEINRTEINKIITNLDIKELNIEKYNKTKAIKFYNIKSKKDVEDQIIEKMAIKDKL